MPGSEKRYPRLPADFADMACFTAVLERLSKVSDCEDWLNADARTYAILAVRKRRDKREKDSEDSEECEMKRSKSAKNEKSKERRE